MVMRKNSLLTMILLFALLGGLTLFTLVHGSVVGCACLPGDADGVDTGGVAVAAVDVEPLFVLERAEQPVSSPVLWKYYPNTSYPIWLPDNYQDYIMPNNSVIISVSKDIGFQKWEGEDRITIYKSGEVWKPVYRGDDARLYRAANQTLPIRYSLASDFWQNPDYYVANGFVGDCEDYALFMASVLEAKGIPYRVVLGGFEGQRHAWVEFTIDGKVYLTDVNYQPGADISGMYTEWGWFNMTTPITWEVGV